MNKSERDDRASRIIADCLRQADGGKSVDPEEVIARHPDCAKELRSYFTNAHLLGNALNQSAIAEPDSAAVPVSEQPTVSPGAGDSVPSGAASFRKLPTNFGRYRVERILGQGAMGAVYLAHDMNLERDVALKTPKLSEVPDAEAVERFRREARSAGALHHRNLCPVFDVGEIKGVHFLTMAYIDGVPLSKAVSADHPPTERQCAAVVRKLAVALQEAHSHGVVHRDLKPANILMDRSREPVIMDFGLAYQMDQADCSRLTGEGTIMGSPAYMSPEQVTGEPSAVGPLADQYSLGVILFELLTGQLPVDGSTVAILAKILAGEQRRIQDVRSGIDSRLAGICSRMMAQRSDDRYPSMLAAANALGQWLKEQELTSAKAGVIEDPKSWVELDEEPLSTDPLPPRQRKRRKRRMQPVPGGVPPLDYSQPLSESRSIPSALPRHSRRSIWGLYLAAGLIGTVALASVIITLSDGTKIETSPGERVEIVSDRDGTTSVKVQPTEPADRSTAPPIAPLEDTEPHSVVGPPKPSPHEILTSEEWTWSEPVFVGEFETHGNMTKVLSDDF